MESNDAKFKLKSSTVILNTSRWWNCSLLC